MSLDMSGHVAVQRPRTTAGQHLSLIAGVLFLVLGVAGFAVSGFGDFTGGTQEQQVLSLATNPLLNVVHLVLGALGLVGRTGARRARWYGVLLFLAGAALFAYTGITGDGGVFNANWPMATFHGVMAFLGLVIALVPVRTGTGPGTAELRHG